MADTLSAPAPASDGQIHSPAMRLRLRDTTALAAGSLVSGVLAYVFFALATRHLGPDDAAAVSVLWTYWSFAAAVLTFPIQHWIARSVAAHGGEGAVRAAMPRVAGLVVAAALVSALLAFAGRDPLFHRDDVWFPLLVAWVTVGSGFIGVVRGSLAARHRFVSSAWALVAENGSRCVAAGALVLAGLYSNVAFGACLAAGAMVGLLWPSTLRFGREQPRGEVESPFAFLSGAAGGQLIGQAVLTGGPVVLALSGGTPAEVTALFAALALFRAPYTLGIGLVSQITGRLAGLVSRGNHAALRKVRLILLGFAAVAVAVASLVGGLIGPWLIALVFGAAVEVSTPVALIVAVGSALALSNLVVTIAILAQNRTHAVARGWTIALVGGAVTFAACLALAPLERTCWAFLAAEAVAFVVLLLEESRGLRKIELAHAGQAGRAGSAAG